MIGLCQSEGIGVIPWSPLARGRLARPWQSDSTKRYETDQFGNKMYSQTEDADRKVVDRLAKVAGERGSSVGCARKIRRWRNRRNLHKRMVSGCVVIFCLGKVIGTRWLSTT